MRIEKFSEEVNRAASEGVNILPIMSLLVMLIPFLIMTTVFQETAVFELYLPKAVTKALPEESAPQDDKKDNLIISLEEKGVRVGINRKMSDYFSIEKLGEKLLELKKGYEDRKDIIILSEPQITYQVIVDVIDACSAVHFSQVSMSAIKAKK